MNTEEHLLVTAHEELSELILEAVQMQKAISKALRFGLDDPWRDNEFSDSPRSLIYREFNDLVGVMELLSERHTFPKQLFNRTMIDEKKKKVVEFGFEYASKQGTLVDYYPD